MIDRIADEVSRIDATEKLRLWLAENNGAGQNGVLNALPGTILVATLFFFSRIHTVYFSLGNVDGLPELTI